MARARLRRFFRHGFLPQLMAFEACVRLGSVTRAAEELCLAQPTVSCMLRKLSETLGGPVTMVSQRRVEATLLGRELLQLCDEMLRALERFENRRQGEGSGYDPVPWPSNYPSGNRSRWRRRASQCPRPKPKPFEADGES
jgi:hypothetical protein